MANQSALKAKDAILKIIKKEENVVKDKQKSVELLQNVLSATRGSECWTISLRIKKMCESKELRIYQRMAWTGHVRNEDGLRRLKTAKILLLTIRKVELKFLGHITRKEGLDNLILTG